MDEITYLPLPFENEKLHLYVKKERLLEIQNDLKTFTSDITYFNKNSFVKDALFPYEVKSNNLIEGYNEDISEVIKIINNPNISQKQLDAEYQRIFNLYKGYNYILNKPILNEENLEYLYSILSKNILDKDDLLEENSRYRKNVGHIYYSSNLAVLPDETINPEKIEFLMDNLFKYINTSNDNLSKEELFFKSQIIHFYFVYIHPYYDINGRTSRTLSLWFLNNSDVSPYVLFNRFIPYDKKNYYKIIRETKYHRNITPFLEFISKGTRNELEKDYIITNLINNSKYEIDPVKKQLLHYILSNKGNNTLLDITNFYNRFNPKKSYKLIDKELNQLFDGNILIKGNNTSKNIVNNYHFYINDELLSIDESKIKKINLSNYTKH